VVTPMEKERQATPVTPLYISREFGSTIEAKKRV
jgi:hypothetical protein